MEITDEFSMSVRKVEIMEIPFLEGWRGTCSMLRMKYEILAIFRTEMLDQC